METLTVFYVRMTKVRRVMMYLHEGSSNTRSVRQAV